MSNVSVRRGGNEFRQIFSDLRTKNDDADEYWQPLLNSYHECLSYMYWISQYRREEHGMVRSHRAVQLRLEASIRELYLMRNSPEEFADVTLGPGLRGTRMAGIAFEMPPIHAYNERLHSRWAMLCHALGGSSSWLCISIADIALPDVILKLLAKSLSKRKSKYDMILQNNNISRDGISVLARIIGERSCLRSLTLGSIELNNLGAAIELAKAIKSNKQLTGFGTIHCGIGSNSRILSTILNSCHEVLYLQLSDICIRGRGVDVLSHFLASNTNTKQLFLRNNQLGDDDAVPLAQSLKSNTNLQSLLLERNNFTQVGIDTLLSSIFDDTSLNSLSDCNRTCQVSLGIGNTKFKLVQFEKKLLHALCTNTQNGCLNIHYLNDVPLECMPKVLALIKVAKESLLAPKFTKTPLNMVFEVLLKWDLPSLYYYRSSQWRHPKEVSVCVNNLVSSIANDGICGFDYHSAHLPYLLPSEYEAIIPVTLQARFFDRYGRGLSMSIGGCSWGPALFLEHHRLQDGSKSTPDFFNLMQLGDVITGINGVSTINVPFDEIVAMLKGSLSFAYLRLEKSRHYNRGEYPQCIDLFEYV